MTNACFSIWKISTPTSEISTRPTYPTNIKFKHDEADARVSHGCIEEALGAAALIGELAGGLFPWGKINHSRNLAVISRAVLIVESHPRLNPVSCAFGLPPMEAVIVADRLRAYLPVFSGLYAHEFGAFAR